MRRTNMGSLHFVSKMVTFLVIGLLVLSSLDVEFQASAQQFPLPADEVKILQTISRKLNISHWKVTADSCHKPAEWNYVSSEDDNIQSNVTCNNCTEPFCHVTNIQLKGFSLRGVIPDEFGSLTYLEELDLTRNYISGTIPKALTQLKNLRILSLLGNRINGSIPRAIGEISTLEELVLEDNLLGGSLPASIGNLSKLRRLLLSANNFTGTIPDNFGNLKSLNDLIDGSQLSGSIPEFIGNWTYLTRLDLQGTSMEGRIPSAISRLTNLTQLRITDLSGPGSNFPDLTGLTKMTKLVLRNCLITGSILKVFGSMAGLKILDLSNNQLTGTIPDQLWSLPKLEYLFLTNNSLTGEIPKRILTSSKHMDLSYNNFTGSVQYICQQSPVNLVSSHSSSHSNSTSWCLREGLPCSRKAQYHSLFINCGGGPTKVDKKEYEEDVTLGGPSNFYVQSERWAYSSTGIYVEKEGDTNFKTGNTFNLPVHGAEYYKTARIAPQSLKYYGLCLQNGSYRVKLHFAEIMFSDGMTYSSLGRRIFDVAIQGNVVLTDFDIAKEAGGVGIGIVKEFDNIYVKGSTLEIHLFWLGKGTNVIPQRAVYGPLISAITVTPNFKVDTGRLPGGAIAGIVISSIFLVAMILLALRITGYLGGKDEEEKELRGLDLQAGYFTLRQIKRATNNFDPSNKIGEGGFGPVYKGLLPDGAMIAVKQLSSKSKQGNREFVNEIGMISALQHPNLVRLFGCCIEGNQLLLVYEYMENNSLARALFGCEEQQLHLDWPTRKKILLGIAKGLTYLHEESRLKIVHRDIKATNVLLDKDLNAKISDFGLAKLNEEQNTHISTRIAGTIGYMAPEYAMRGYLTDKADVYSFGVVVLEIVSGKSNTSYRPKEKFIYLLDWAYVLQEQGNLLELVDPNLGSNYSTDEAMRWLNLALLCTNPSPSLRPQMSSIVKMLEGKIPVEAPIVKRIGIGQEARIKAFEILSHDSQNNASSTSNQDLDHSSSSRLSKDLYDVNLD